MKCDRCLKDAIALQARHIGSPRLCDDCFMHDYGDTRDLNPEHCQECKEVVEHAA